MCIVYFKFILQGQTDNQPYMEMWKYRNGYVKLGVERKAWLWLIDWILHHDSAPAHKVRSVKHFLAQKRLLKWITHPIPLIWLLMTSGCLQKWSLP
jgi:hypothetical protein